MGRRLGKDMIKTGSGRNCVLVPTIGGLTAGEIDVILNENRT